MNILPKPPSIPKTAEMDWLEMVAQFTQMKKIKDIDANFKRGRYIIPGETTELYRIQHEETGYTIVEIAAPKDINLEATLALMREVDPVSGGPEFLDLYNNGYEGMKQHGIRIQKRGTGELRPFVLDFYDGNTVTSALRVNPSGTMDFSGHVILWTPKSIMLYADWEVFTFNDFDVWHAGVMGGSGGTDARPSWYKVGAYFFDTTLGIPIWHKGDGVWVDATGAVV